MFSEVYNYLTVPTPNGRFHFAGEALSVRHAYVLFLSSGLQSNDIWPLDGSLVLSIVFGVQLRNLWSSFMALTASSIRSSSTFDITKSGLGES